MLQQWGLERSYSLCNPVIGQRMVSDCQTEKEALALVWACECFNMYVFHREFELEQDHKPLEFTMYIYSQKSKPSARVERWLLRL